MYALVLMPGNCSRCVSSGVVGQPYQDIENLLLTVWARYFQWKRVVQYSRELSSYDPVSSSGVESHSRYWTCHNPHRYTSMASLHGRAYHALHVHDGASKRLKKRVRKNKKQPYTDMASGENPDVCYAIVVSDFLLKASAHLSLVIAF